MWLQHHLYHLLLNNLLRDLTGMSLISSCCSHQRQCCSSSCCQFRLLPHKQSSDRLLSRLRLSSSRLSDSLLIHQVRRRLKGAQSLLCQMKRQRTPPSLIREAPLSSQLTSRPHQLYLMRPTVLHQHHLHL